MLADGDGETLDHDLAQAVGAGCGVAGLAGALGDHVSRHGAARAGIGCTEQRRSCMGAGIGVEIADGDDRARHGDFRPQRAGQRRKGRGGGQRGGEEELGEHRGYPSGQPARQRRFEVVADISSAALMMREFIS